MLTPQPWHHRTRHNGFTLVEAAVVVTIAALLATIAWPAFASVVRRIHRTDALAALAHVQLLQQRHRSLHPGYATLAQLGIGVQVAGGRYRLDLSEPTASGYRLSAVAQGPQAADAVCRHLGVEVVGADTRRSSGPDAETHNEVAQNRRCWGG